MGFLVFVVASALNLIFNKTESFFFYCPYAWMDIGWHFAQFGNEGRNSFLSMQRLFRFKKFAC
ncbi:hypothetical protein DUD43_07085 [Alcaligenes faecalis]|nr:hypothetical protein DUD43_07085 [Alcaligenes faecalis]